MPDQFPPIGLKTDSHDRNPAIRLFGRRLFVDQSVPELLLEFLLVAASPKRVGPQERPRPVFFPIWTSCVHGQLVTVWSMPQGATQS